MNTEFSAPAPFEIDRAVRLCQNYKHDLQTRMVSRFRGVSATDGEVGSNLCRDEKRTERQGTGFDDRFGTGSNLCRDEKRTESSALVGEEKKEKE